MKPLISNIILIVVEIVEAARDFTIGAITDFANSIYRTEQVPGRMREPEFIVIPKKS